MARLAEEEQELTERAWGERCRDGLGRLGPKQDEER